MATKSFAGLQHHTLNPTDWLSNAVAATDALAGAVVTAGEAPRILSLYPEGSVFEELLVAAAMQALTQQERAIANVPGSGEPLVVWPLATSLGAVVLVLPVSAEDLVAERAARLDALLPGLETEFYRVAEESAVALSRRQAAVLAGFEAVLDETRFKSAALAFVNYLVRHLGAERAVLGTVRDAEVDVIAQSDSSHYTVKVNTMRLTRDAMQEAVDQLQSIQVPTSGQDTVSRAHVALAAAAEGAVVLSVPMIHADLSCYGVVLLERTADKPFDEDEIARIEALANLVGRLLEDRRLAQQPLYKLAAGAIRRFFATFLGPGYLRRKVFAMLLLAAVVLFSFLEGDYRPGGEAVLEGAELRAVIAPFDGFLESAAVRAGDEVQEGDELAALDTRELRLERLRWLSEQAQARRQFEDALARADRAQAQIHTAEVERATAQLGLLDFQIDRARLNAPFDATIVEGDLSQRIGSAVRQGDTLFELAPLDRYRLTIFFDEFEIGDVEAGQTGRAVLSALPDRELSVKVVRITPMAEVRNGETVFRVEAELLDPPDTELRPGLVGVGRIFVERRLLIDIWTRPLRDWLFVQWWRL